VNGTSLAIGLAAVVALPSVLRRGGSLARSGLQEQLLRLKNQWKADPEVAIRAQDLVLTILPGDPVGPAGLPGLWETNAQLLYDVRKLGGHGLDDYLALVSRQIAANEHFSKRLLSVDIAWQRYIPWIGREVGRLIRASRRNEIPVRQPRWGSSESQESALLREMQSLRNQLPRVLDWAMATGPDLMTLRFKQAKARSDRWHAQGAGGEGLTVARGVPLPGEVVYRFADGWTVQRLGSFRHLQSEGQVLHHCVGRGTYYWDGVVSGKWTIESLRDPKGKPYVTLTVLPNGRIIYAKGHFDRLAGERMERRYAPSTYDKLTDEALDLECLRLDEYQRFRDPPPGDVASDLVTCARRLELIQARAAAQAQAKARAQGQGRSTG
jgi:hypothetical protein